MNPLLALYHRLLDQHGHQGWWPLKGNYHPKDYSFPHNDLEKFEIGIGAILTQNTTWKNVEKSLLALGSCLSPSKILDLSDAQLQDKIHSSGYYIQKTKKLKNWANFFIKINHCTPTREELLSIWGVGPETADSILLYAYQIPIFVVDTYTKRLLIKENLISSNANYAQVQAYCESQLPRQYELFQEFHALIVENNKS